MGDKIRLTYGAMSCTGQPPFQVYVESADGEILDVLEGDYATAAEAYEKAQALEWEQE